MSEDLNAIGTGDESVKEPGSAAIHANCRSRSPSGRARIAGLPIALLLPALALWIPACTSDQPPTEPEASGNGSPGAPSLASASNTWTTRAALPGGACEISTGLAINAAGQSTVYVFGGTVCQEGGDALTIHAYNVTNDTWRTKAAEYTGASTNGVGKIAGKFYISGGISFGSGSEVATVQTFAYDIAADRITRKADMPKATAEGVSGVINDKLYVLPGFCEGQSFPNPSNCETEPIRQLYRYDPVTNTWTTKRLAPHFHRGGAGGVIDHKFYVVGGTKECCDQERVAALDVYDPATNTWTTLAPMPTPGPVIGAVLRGKLFVIPGPGVLYIYDPATNTWKTKRGPTFAHAAATRVRIDERDYLLAVGGSHGPQFDIPNPTELYTP